MRTEAASLAAALEEELDWWEGRRVEVPGGHRLARYRVEAGGPRPESYRSPEQWQRTYTFVLHDSR